MFGYSAVIVENSAGGEETPPKPKKVLSPEEQIRSLEMVAERIHEHGAGIKTCDCLGCQSSFPIRE
jgi:hypothetical protein